MSGVFWAVTTGSTFCPECGAHSVESVAPSLLLRFRRWLVQGEHVGPTLRCGNGHSWQASSYAVAQLRSRSRITRALRVPIAVLSMLRRKRRLEPAPITYVVAAGAGTVVAVVTNLLWGWPWWLVGAGFVLAVWLFFASTAFWGPYRVTRLDLLRAVNPRRARQREMDDLEDEVRSGRLRVYALSDWPGDARLGGVGRHRGQRRVTLRFVDPDDDAVWVEVASTAGGVQEPLALQRELLAENLLTAITDVPPFDDIHQMHAWHEARRRDNEGMLRGLCWEAGVLTMSGEPVDVEIVRINDGAAVIAVLDEATIHVSTRRCDPEQFALAGVTSLRPFIEAMEEYRPK